MGFVPDTHRIASVGFRNLEICKLAIPQLSPSGQEHVAV